MRDLQSGGVAPVDLAQAAIGPGMAVFSSYAKVVEPDGTAMRVRTALALINQVLDEVAAEQEGEFDEDTRWAIAWYAEQGMDEGATDERMTSAERRTSVLTGSFAPVSSSRAAARSGCWSVTSWTRDGTQQRTVV